MPSPVVLRVFSPAGAQVRAARRQLGAGPAGSMVRGCICAAPDSLEQRSAGGATARAGSRPARKGFSPSAATPPGAVPSRPESDQPPLSA